MAFFHQSLIHNGVAGEEQHGHVGLPQDLPEKIGLEELIKDGALADSE